MSRRRRRGNAKQRLQKQLEIQRELEKELEALNKADPQEKSAKAIIKYVQNAGADPMLNPENPFLEAGPPKCCQIL